MEKPKKKPLWRKVVDAVATGLVALVAIGLWLFEPWSSVTISGWASYAFGGAIATPFLIGLFFLLRTLLRAPKGRTGTPKKVVTVFYRAVRKGDFDAAYYLFHPDLQRVQRRREFRRLETDLSRLLRKNLGGWATDIGGWGTDRLDQSALVITWHPSVMDPLRDTRDFSAKFFLNMRDNTWEIAAYVAQDEVGRIGGGTFPEERYGSILERSSE